MEKSTDYKYFSFDADNSILYHEVNDENFSDKESFVTSLTYFTTLIERFRPKGIIVRIYKKPDYFELELKDYMKKTLYTTLLSVGTKKVAFYIHEGKYISELQMHERNDSIQAKFFLDLALAEQWIKS